MSIKEKIEQYEIMKQIGRAYEKEMGKERFNRAMEKRRKLREEMVRLGWPRK